MKTDQKLKVGLRIKEFRTEILDLTQTELAKEIDTTQKSISNYESGDVFPSTAFFDKMAANYGAVPDWFLTGIGSPRVVRSERIKAKKDPDIRIAVLESKINLIEKQVTHMEEQLEKMVALLEKIAGSTEEA